MRHSAPIDGLQHFQVERFVFASTMLDHKPTAAPDERINEDSPIGAMWAYPQSKVDTEALLHERHGKIPVVYPVRACADHRAVA